MSQEKIGEYLVEQGILSSESLAALVKAKEGESIQANSITFHQNHLHYMKDNRLAKALGSLMGASVIRDEELQVDPNAVSLVSANYADRHNIVPLMLGNHEMDLYVLCTKPLTDDEIKYLTDNTYKTIRPVLLGQQEFIEYYNQAYPDNQKTLLVPSQDTDEQSEVVKRLNQIILGALEERATDIHLEPISSITRIRYRIDGVLHNITELQSALAMSVLSRIKVMSDLDITRKYITQEGSFRFEHQSLNRPALNIRVSIMPCTYGEKIVLRILPPEDELLGLEELGMEDETLDQLKNIVAVPHGVVLVTGPSANGKSTTLYSMLATLRSESINISTVEDPVEIMLSGINQVQLDSLNKLTFADALHSFLRQDPDIMMIGEVREPKAAQLLLQAGLTGHLVFSTLHTNDATGSFKRLVDMGCEPYLVASSVRAVVAQRLVRVNCDHCKQKREPKELELQSFNISKEDMPTIWEGQGCEKCRGTGYIGRCGIFELLEMTEEIQNLIVHDMHRIDEAIRQENIKALHPLREDGLQKIRKGITTPEEVMHSTLFW